MRFRLLIPLAIAGALVAPSAAVASHSWNGWHWSRTSATENRTLTVSDGVSGAWDTLRPDVFNRWNTALAAKLTLSSVATSKANITSTSGSFGKNGWLGLAQVWIRGSHITKASVKLNDFYFNIDPTINTVDAKQQVFCQEVGHVLGLDHQTAADSCMNDTNDLATAAAPYPNAHDADELGILYNHADGSSKHSAHERGPFTVDRVRAF